MENESEDTNAPESPGGTTVENGIETVTVEASRLPNWKIALIIAALVYGLTKL